MKIFAVIPSRNDAWILPLVLKTASLWADQIIVADENSWDNTDEVCKQFPKVRVIKFEPKEFNESNRRQMLLEAVRQYDGQNLVFGLDSDEILSAEILQAEVKENLIRQMHPGMSAKLQWIMLWKHVNQYRYDNSPEWSGSWKNFVYWDDRKINFSNVKMHSSRVPESTLQNSITFNSVKVLHFAFADWQRMLAKHKYYLALEKTMGSQTHPYLLNRKYRWFYKESKEGIVVKPVSEDWVAAYKQQGITMENFSSQELYWYEEEVLRFFKQKSLKFFKHLNIWDQDWEKKRLLASKAGSKDIYQFPIINPQPWYDRWYYKYFQGIIDMGGPLERIVKRINYK